MPPNNSQSTTKLGTTFKYVLGGPVAFFGAAASAASSFAGLQPLLELFGLSETAIKSILGTSVFVEFIQSLCVDGKYSLEMFEKLGDYVCNTCCKSKDQDPDDIEQGLLRTRKELEKDPRTAISSINKIITRIIGTPLCLIGAFSHSALSFIGTRQALPYIGLTSSNFILGLAVAAAIVEFVQTLATEGSHTYSGLNRTLPSVASLLKSALLCVCCRKIANVPNERTHLLPVDRDIEQGAEQDAMPLQRAVSRRSPPKRSELGADSVDLPAEESIGEPAILPIRRRAKSI